VWLLGGTPLQRRRGVAGYSAQTFPKYPFDVHNRNGSGAHGGTSGGGPGGGQRRPPRSERAGEAIPIGSRIVFVCSAFHDMTSDRPHHAALEPADALAQLERGAGSQFDPKVVAAFCAELSDDSEPDLDVVVEA